MFTASVVVTVLASVANAFAATLDFVRYKQVSIAMAKAGVPESWMTMLGILKAAGALGLLVGIGVSLIGTAAAVGLILFFVGAINHPPACRRLLVRPGGRVPPAGRRRAGVATGLVLSITRRPANAGLK